MASRIDNLGDDATGSIQRRAHRTAAQIQGFVQSAKLVERGLALHASLAGALAQTTGSIGTSTAANPKSTNPVPDGSGSSRAERGAYDGRAAAQGNRRLNFSSAIDAVSRALASLGARLSRADAGLGRVTSRLATKGAIEPTFDRPETTGRANADDANTAIGGFAKFVARANAASRLMLDLSSKIKRGTSAPAQASMLTAIDSARLTGNAGLVASLLRSADRRNGMQKTIEAGRLFGIDAVANAANSSIAPQATRSTMPEGLVAQSLARVEAPRGIAAPALEGSRIHLAEPTPKAAVSEGSTVPITINSSPTIVIQAGGAAQGLERAVADALRTHRVELFDQFKREATRRERVEF